MVIQINGQPDARWDVLLKRARSLEIGVPQREGERAQNRGCFRPPSMRFGQDCPQNSTKQMEDRNGSK